ncbi:hypothetical protein [Candidatus Avelusimicrobium sp.]|uniref:hypothetical protein n=1 Tax=Candidatus Avelusimicrobium sp. TaxID=3048833 RepID=UPI003D7CBFF3
MRAIFILLAACLLAAPAYAQRVSVQNQPAPVIVDEPDSNIDLLKQSIEASQPTVAVPKTAAPAAKTPAPAVTTANTPASSAPANSANTLDMPLSMGGTVTSVQTSVAPAKKTLSPSAAKRVQAAKSKRRTAAQTNTAKKAASPQKAVKPTQLEKDIEKNNALLPPGEQAENEAEAENTEEESSEEAAADAELEYAVRMLEKSKEAAESAGRKIPAPASQNRPNKVPAPNKKFNPNAFRPGVTWVPSQSTHFEIYTQKRTGSGISSSNMSMTFENAYQTLRRFIPWMMSGKVRVFVYQDHQSYLRYEPNAKAWSGALAYPTRGEIIVYDTPGNKQGQNLKESFTHELTHIFTQQFFDSHKTGRIMTPTWLDEGLAVLLEDQSYAGGNGPWNNDFKTLNFQRDPANKPGFGSFSSSSSFGKTLTAKRQGPPQYLVPFDQFMEEGSLEMAESRNKTQDWYFQAYAMVRFLLNPAGGTSPSNRMQFEQFTRLLAQGEAVRDPATGFLQKDSRGKTVYQPYSVEKALGRSYRYATASAFEDAFWRWANR